MTDESTQEIEQPPSRPESPRPESLTDEDKRLLAALLDELLGRTADGRPTPTSHGAVESPHHDDAPRSAPLASQGR